MTDMLAVLPFTIWGCAGVESVTFMTDLVEKPTKDIPRALIAGVWTLVAVLFGTLFVAASVSPGLTGVLTTDDANNIAAAYYYLVPGFVSMGISETTGIWLTMVAVYGCVISCLSPVAKLMQQMMGSQLLPSIPGYLDENTNSTALLAVIFCFLLTVIALLHPEFNMTYLSIGFCMLSYMNDLYAFIKLRLDFGEMQREFFSPFGILGAIYAFSTFTLIFIGNFGYTNIPYLKEMFWGIIGGFTIYYFGIARWYEKFSKHEEKHLLIFHIIKFNKSKRAQITHKLRRSHWTVTTFHQLFSAPIQKALEMKLIKEICQSVNSPPQSTAAAIAAKKSGGIPSRLSDPASSQVPAANPSANLSTSLLAVESSPSP
jgi:amino acid transporter